MRLLIRISRPGRRIPARAASPTRCTAGPDWIQIGTEGGFLPEPVVIPPQPLAWNMNPTAFNVGNVTDRSLLLGCAERADVIVDFSQHAGKTLILYNDAPAAFPALDPRYDYYTGCPDQMDAGGAPSTLPGYGPNVRTIMQFNVGAVGGGAQVLSGVTVTAGGADYAYMPDVEFSGGGGSGAAAIASGGLDHITVLNGGSGYATAPTVNIAGTTGTAATASTTVSVDSLTFAPGAGYLAAPTVQLTDTGVGTGLPVSGTTTISAAAIVVDSGGSGYTAPSVSITDPTGAGVGATATATMSLSAILVDPLAIGSGYTAPVVTITDVLGGSGTGADATAAFDLVTGAITGFTVVTAGSGYTGFVVTIADSLGGTGSGALAIATGAVDGFVFTAGTGYSAPLVTITDPDPGASGAVAHVTGVVEAVTFALPRRGYTAPLVTFTGGSPGTAATATTLGGVDGWAVTPEVQVTPPHPRSVLRAAEEPALRQTPWCQAGLLPALRTPWPAVAIHLLPRLPSRAGWSWAEARLLRP